MTRPYAPGDFDPARDELAQLRRLRLTSIVEASTLLLLLLVAVPLKHLAGFPLGVRIMGPVHGLAFVLYFWTVLQTVSSGGWRRSEQARLIIAGLLPFGGFASLGFLRRRSLELEARQLRA